MNSDSIIDTGSKILNDFTATLLELLPRFITALAVLVAGLILGWIIRILVRRFILYLNVALNVRLKNRSLGVELGGVAILISKIFYWVIIILTIAIVTHILNLPVITTWLDGLVTYLPNILAGILIVFIGIIVGKLTGDLVASGSARSGMTNAEQLGKFVRYLLIVISIFVAIDQVGIDIFLITLVFGIVLSAFLFGAALAFGLGAKSSVSNILGAYYFQKTFKEGDTIQIDDLKGVVVKITPTSVLIETKDGQVMVPARDFNKKKTLKTKTE